MMSALGVFRMPPSLGARKFDLETPLLCIDCERLDSHLTQMAATLRKCGKAWRPHIRSHRAPALAQRQRAAGAVGAACTTIAEAEALAAAGVSDLLITRVVVEAVQHERVAVLCRTATPVVTCDHFMQAEALAAVCRQEGITPRVVIEVNIGQERVGTRPGRDTLDLARGISRLRGVELVGVTGDAGHLLSIAASDERRRRLEDAVGLLVRCRDQFQANGLRCDIVSAGGTEASAITAQVPGITEFQDGNVFGEAFSGPAGGNFHSTPALTLLATVISRPTFDRAVLDAGHDSIDPRRDALPIKGYSDAVARPAGPELCVVQLGPFSRELKIGDKVELMIGGSEITPRLHDAFYAFRGDRLEAVWPILRS